MATEQGKTFIERAPKDKDNPYGMIRRAVFDGSGLTFEARGVMGYILMKPDNWRARIKDLMREGEIGRDQAYRIVNELIEKRYAERIEERDEHGHFAGTTIRIHEQPLPEDEAPCTGNPHTDNPQADNPQADNPHTENTEHNNNGVLPITDPEIKTEKKKGKDAPHPMTRPIIDAYVECIGYTPAPSEFKRIGPDAKHLAQQGCTPDDIKGAYAILQCDNFWRDKTIPLGKLLPKIEHTKMTIRNGRGVHGERTETIEGYTGGWTPESLERARAAKAAGDKQTLAAILRGDMP